MQNDKNIDVENQQYFSFYHKEDGEISLEDIQRTDVDINRISIEQLNIECAKATGWKISRSTVEGVVMYEVSKKSRTPILTTSPQYSVPNFAGKIGLAWKLIKKLQKQEGSNWYIKLGNKGNNNYWWCYLSECRHGIIESVPTDRRDFKAGEILTSTTTAFRSSKLESTNQESDGACPVVGHLSDNDPGCREYISQGSTAPEVICRCFLKAYYKVCKKRISEEVPYPLPQNQLVFPFARSG